ncbi:MAG: RluA family pseudouridine synthase [Pyrinomonadaceae bacterium]
MPERYEFQITEADAKKKLDEFLFARFFHLSKMFLRESLIDGKCEVNGKLVNFNYKLRVNDFVELEIEYGERQIIKPEQIPLEIIFEDAELLVVNKAAGMLVHPTVKYRNGTLLNALVYYLNSENLQNEKNGNLNFSFSRAGLVHRLDKQTSGLLIVAKNARSHKILSGHFKRKLIEKRYYAVVEGNVENDVGEINAPIGRFAEERIWNIKTDGKIAITKYWVKTRFKDSTLLELEPVTGRTNQLRIHLAHIGHPIFGDTKYGGRQFGRMCLHAYKLNFWHPNGNQRLEFETGLPEEMKIGK